MTFSTKENPMQLFKSS